MKFLRTLFALVVILSMAVPGAAFAKPDAALVNVTILHFNDFHGQLEPVSGSNPGAARLAAKVKTELMAANSFAVDMGDSLQGSLLSNLTEGEPVVEVYNEIGLTATTFGNHEFDWGLDILGDRAAQAVYPYLSANIVAATDCANPGWAKPSFVDAPYLIWDEGGAKIGLIAVTTPETPYITLAGNTAGLCFVDPAAAILHYYDDMRAAGADAIVVMSHLGLDDGGYGYGIPVYGDKTLAKKLNTAGKPVDLILGGHTHRDMTEPVMEGSTAIVQAHYNGRKVGKAVLTIDTDTNAVSVAWTRLVVVLPNPAADPPVVGDPLDPAVEGIIASYTSDAAYTELINDPVGYTAVDLLRNYNGDSMMADFIDDAVYNKFNTDADTANDIDLFMNNAGGIRADWCALADPGDPTTGIWGSTADCNTGLNIHEPMLLTYGNMFNILPFGNQAITGKMTGAQIMGVLHQAATLEKGAIQVSGLRYKFYNYKDGPPATPVLWAWGAFDVEVYDKATSTWMALDLTKVYNVGTNEFLAPAGQDGYQAFKYMVDISYWGDMLNIVNEWVSAEYDTPEKAYSGPEGDGELDGRIIRDGTDAGGSIVPVTILHHNDSHGRLAKDPVKNYVGYTQLATLIAQERLHNPDRTFLFNLGDQIQGDSMAYYFKDAGAGYASDGSTLPAAQSINPIIAVMNALDYDGMLLGNHEFNFGPSVFRSAFGKALFPLLGANVTDSGEYGIIKMGFAGDSAAPVSGPKIPVNDFLNLSVSGTAANPNPIKVGFLGLTNHRVPSYELPSNIIGLTFSNPLEKAAELVPDLADLNDAVVALTHIGFTEDPKSVEVDANVDTNLAATVAGIDAILGSHSHTDPTKGFGDYKFLPTMLAGPDGEPVIVSQAYRYNTYLGKVVLGFRPVEGGAWELVSQTGKAIPVGIAVVEDPAIKAIVDPYAALLADYNNQDLGQTKIEIDARLAYTQETNAANLQADAAVFVLTENDIEVDFHLSGAMSNTMIAAGATDAAPYSLKISDMFAAMPYENSLVVLEMNGPQLKAVLERAYRNYFFYKYVTGYGGYSYYTTCMLDTNMGNQIVYNDTYPLMPNGQNVVALNIGDETVDFADAATFYNVSTVNYLAAGACNFSDNGKTLWPLDQIAEDTQYYVRDAVIDYIAAQTEAIKPIVDPDARRLVFNLLNHHNFIPMLAR